MIDIEIQGGTMNIRFDLIIDRPRQAVWRAFDNPENLSLWQPSLLSFKEIVRVAGRLGTRSKLIYEIDERIIEIIETITSRNEPELFSAQYENNLAISFLDNHFIFLVVL